MSTYRTLEQQQVVVCEQCNLEFPLSLRERATADKEHLRADDIKKTWPTTGALQDIAMRVAEHDKSCACRNGGQVEHDDSQGATTIDERLKELDRHVQHARESAEKALHPHQVLDVAKPKEELGWTGHF